MTRENISLWLQKSEPDYYLFFLRAWIPFNAWYVEEYPQLKKKDTEIIKEIQNSSSKPKNIIKNYLENSSYDSLKFQSYLAELHFELEKTHVDHNGRRLTFKDLALSENPITYKNDTDNLDNVYKAEKTSSYFHAYIEAKGGRVIYDLRKPIYDYNDLTRDTNYIRLTRPIQKKILNLYKEINPKQSVNIISLKKSGSQLLRSENSCRIINDTDIVAKACIKILYSIRCMLFHGEIAPNEANKKIYENGFYILKLIIKGLR